MTVDSVKAARKVTKGSLAKSGTVLALAVLVSNAGNYLLNILLARWLTPAQFSDANLMVALMLTVTSLAACLQLVAARYTGVFDAAGEPGKSRKLESRLNKTGLVLGVLLAGTLMFASPFWADVFNTESWVPFAVLGLGMPFYLAQSVTRGVLQGRLAFGRLAVTYIVEMSVRLALSLALVVFGLGVTGATVGLTVSFVATWLCVRLLARSDGSPVALMGRELKEIKLYAGSVALLLLGQIICNNSDVFVSKAVMDPHDAGIYSAIALVGRAVFFLAWSVATVVFPVAARDGASDGGKDLLLRGAVTVVVGLGAVCTAGAYFFGGPALAVVLGPEYAGLEIPLSAYAAVTTVFAVANMIATHKLSKGSSIQARMLLAGAIVQSVLLILWDDSTASLIEAKLLGGVLILLAVVIATIWSSSTARRRQEESLQ